MLPYHSNLQQLEFEVAVVLLLGLAMRKLHQYL